ncbi:MAG TPA: transporter [Xanthobacteraceae bacterium]
MSAARPNLVASSALLSLLALALSQSAHPAEATAVEKQLNPIADVTKLSTTASVDFGVGPDHKSQPALNFQPVLPFRLNDDWHVITRSSVSLTRLPDPEKTTGLGDLSSSFFLSPARTGAWIWGAGPIMQLPTATDTLLGTGKWSAGPTAAFIYANEPWVNGILVSHLWSFAGAHDREEVSLTQIESQLSYTYPSNWYIQTNPTFAYDWKAPAGQRWTVPLGFDVGRIFPSRLQGMGWQLGAYSNVVRPDGAAHWQLRAQFSVAY